MALQLIFCVETDKKCKSDYMYIKSAVEQFYVIDNAQTKISPVYMKGKGNYRSKSIKREIESLRKQYGSSPNRESKVIYYFDCDNYDSNPIDAVFLDKAKSYCLENNYEFVWFCKDIEHVFLKRQVPKEIKKREATSFVANNKKLDSKFFSARHFQNTYSNMCLVLDNYLQRI